MSIFRRLFEKSYNQVPNQGTEYKQQSEPNFLSNRLQENISKIHADFGNSDDIVIREFSLAHSDPIQVAIIFADGLVDMQMISEYIMEALMSGSVFEENRDSLAADRHLLQVMRDQFIAIGSVYELRDFHELYLAVLSGNTVILVDGYNQGIATGTQGGKERDVTESTRESVIRGPKESFSESIRTNTSLIRKRIKNPNLWLESRTIGKVTKTNVALMYIHGIADVKIVEEVRRRLNRIDTDAILESGYIEEWIQDEWKTPFPTLYNSERPDVISAELLEGKIAILVDRSPMVLIIPALFVSFFHSAEDYYEQPWFSSIIRLLRYLCISINLLGPSLYIAITTFHQQMLPTDLLISLAAQREGVPFPAFVEALMMEIAFEILREGGLRMPRTVGQAMSIVGTLVIGQAAVEAGIVSPAMVIVVSITAIASFVIPAYNMAIAFRILRFPMMGLAAVFGLFGIFLSLLGIALHLCSLRSFGVPYMSPFGPFNLTDQKDAIFRFPHWLLFSRPRLINKKNILRSKRPFRSNKS